MTHPKTPTARPLLLVSLLVGAVLTTSCGGSGGGQNQADGGQNQTDAVWDHFDWDEADWS